MKKVTQQGSIICNFIHKGQIVKRAIHITILILVTMTAQASAPSIEELRAISTTLNEYLENGKDKGIEAALNQTSQPQYKNYSRATKLTLEYLCDEDITEDEIQNACSENPFTWSLSCVSFFIHSFAVDHSRNTTDFDYYLRAYTENYDYLKELNNASVSSIIKEIGTWSPRVNKWNEWVGAGLVPQKDLEPLFLGETSDDWLKTVDISTITLGDFLTSRKNFKNRPRFNPAKVNNKKIKAYLKSIEDVEQKKLEFERIKMVIKLKSIAKDIINTYGYTGAIGAAKRKVSGTTTKATEKSIFIKRKSGRKATRRWRDVTTEQYLSILKGRTMGVYDTQKNVVLILDWFGEYETALALAKKVKAQKDKDFLNKYLLGKD